MADIDDIPSATKSTFKDLVILETAVDDPEVPVRIPWTYKWLALLCVVTFPLGQNWTQASLGPLKNTLRNELGITNTQFGVISSADAIVNSIWPIIGGIFLDYYGPNVITPMCTVVSLVGSLISAAGINIGNWRMLVGGNILMGLGIAVLDSAQQKFFYHWSVALSCLRSTLLTGS